MTIICLTNQKGGTGKTTVAVQLAAAAARRGDRTLLVDADPQGNATSALTEGLTPETRGLANALSTADPHCTLADIITPGIIWPTLDVAPTTGGGLHIVAEELVLDHNGAPELRLSEQLAQVRHRYDTIIIDTAPSLNRVTLNGLAAADRAAAVVTAHHFALSGLVELMDTITTAQEHYAPHLQFTGVIVNRYDRREREQHISLQQIRRASADGLFSLLEPIIPARAAIGAATEQSRDLTALRNGRELATLFTDHLTTLTTEAH